MKSLNGLTCSAFFSLTAIYPIAIANDTIIIATILLLSIFVTILLGNKLTITSVKGVILSVSVELSIPLMMNFSLF